MIVKDAELETILNLCDWHVPFIDKKVFDVAIQIVKNLKPSKIIIHEVIDFYSISKYDKDPKRKLTLQKDLNDSFMYMRLLRNVAPDADIIMVESNHDKRLQKYLRSRAEELSQLDCLKFEKLMMLDVLNISYKPYYVYKNFLWKHGSVVRNQSGYTARAERDREGMSGASGHTHRLAMHFKTLHGGKYGWIEGGCLCKTENIEYVDGTADWQNGISGIDFIKNRYYPFVIPIIDNKAIFGRQLYVSD